MKKKIIFLATILIVCVCMFSGCTINKDAVERIAKETGIEIVNEDIEDIGFAQHNYDEVKLYGVSYQYKNTIVLDKIKADKKWQAFPLPSDVKTFVWGNENGLGAFLTTSEQEKLIPEFANGYFYIIDRQKQDGKSDILNGKKDLSIYLYDTDNNIFYAYWYKN